MNDERSERALLDLSALIDSSQDPFLLLDRTGAIVYANAAAAHLPGLAPAVRRQMPRDLLDTPGCQWRGEVGLESAEDAGPTFDVQVRCGHESLAIHARDMSASVRLQRQLAHLATHDVLTDLPNRAHLLRRLADAIERCEERRTGCAVVYLDIDDLKSVNDTAGHEFGDLLLMSIAQRLRHATRPGDVVARISGDEFVVVCDDIEDEEAARGIAETLRLAVSGPTDVPALDLDVSVSIGVVLFRGRELAVPVDRTANELLREADSAMYRAKRRGKSRSELFTEDMRTAERERALLTRDFGQALERHELFLVYQPIVSPHTGRATAAEALVRWLHPTRGVLLPSNFLDVTGDPRRSAALGQWVIRQAAADLRSWMDAGRVDGRFAVHVNVSRAQVADPEFTGSVMSALSDVRLRAAQFVVEFHESVVLDDAQDTTTALQSLRRNGVRLSLDDFGSGTSSLTNLQRCPVDFVKLDGSLVRGLGEGDEPIVRSMIHLAHGFDASVIAESVTSDVQVERLTTLGCDFLQGFHVGRPVPAAEFDPSTATVPPA